MTGKDDALAALTAHRNRITAAKQTVANLQAEIPALVVDALNAGATWRDIAEATGNSHAHRDYSKHIEADVQRRYSVKTSTEETTMTDTNNTGQAVTR